MGDFGYRSLKTLRLLSTRMDFKKIALKALCGDCRKGNQNRQPSRTSMFQSTEFLVEFKVIWKDLIRGLGKARGSISIF